MTRRSTDREMTSPEPRISKSAIIALALIEAVIIGVVILALVLRD